jgi:protein TonB
VLALPESNPVAEPVFSVPRAAETRTEVASVAPTLPGFSAAYLRNPAPRYPVAARRAGEQGTVTLRVLVMRDGQPARVDVEKSSGSAHLDAAALEAVKVWRFVPARQGTDAIESWVLVPIVFRLESPS